MTRRPSLCLVLLMLATLMIPGGCGGGSGGADDSAATDSPAGTDAATGDSLVPPNPDDLNDAATEPADLATTEVSETVRVAMEELKAGVASQRGEFEKFREKVEQSLNLEAKNLVGRAELLFTEIDEDIALLASATDVEVPARQRGIQLKLNDIGAMILELRLLMGSNRNTAPDG